MKSVGEILMEEAIRDGAKRLCKWVDNELLKEICQKQPNLGDKKGESAKNPGDISSKQVQRYDDYGDILPESEENGEK